MAIFGTLRTAAIKKKFLLKFARDQRRYLHWVFIDIACSDLVTTIEPALPTHSGLTAKTWIG